MIETLSTTAQLCELLNLHEETVRKYARAGELRSYRIGNDRRYPESGVREFLAAREEQQRYVRPRSVGRSE